MEEKPVLRSGAKGELPPAVFVIRLKFNLYDYQKGPTSRFPGDTPNEQRPFYF